MFDRCVGKTDWLRLKDNTEERKMMNKKYYKSMVGLLALVVAIGTTAVAQDVTNGNLTVTNQLTVIGPDSSTAGESRGIEGEAPIIIDQGDGTSLLFTRSAAIVFTRTNEASGSVTADINGDVELTERVVSVETYRYSIYAEKLIDNNTLVDIPREGLPSPLYRAGSGGSNSVGTILFNFNNTAPITVDSSEPDPADWSIPVDALYPPHKDLIADPIVYIRSGGSLQVGGNANVDGDVDVGGALRVQGTDVMGAIGDAAALADLAAYDAAALSQPAEEEAEAAPVASASVDGFSISGLGVASGFTGDNYVMSWSTSAGKNYQIQSSVDLETWEDVGLVLTGNGSTMTWANAIVDSQCYYRVIELD